MIVVAPKKLRHRLTSQSLAVGAALCAVAWPAMCAQAAPEKATSPDLHLRVSKNGTRTPLDDYIARPEPAYHWRAWTDAEKAEAQKSDPFAMLTAPISAGTTRDEIELTSQEWQGTTWTHRLSIFRPDNGDFADTAIIYVTFGAANNPADIAVGANLAKQTGATFVHLSGIPKQPLWGLKEDGLISYTFEQYMKTGDATWPLLLPMAKSVVKTMDALSEYSRQPGRTPLRRFVIAGASKRGWTTWLAGAVDQRVIGIVPIVYDNLNLAKQMPRQIETWGEYSVMIQDYTKRGLQAQLATPRGQQLGAMVDPWMYRDRLTMPKLIVNGTNDPYWTLGALNVYINDLKGPTNVLYSPNGGHDLGGMMAAQRVMQSVGGWVRRVAAKKPLPTTELFADVPNDAKISPTQRQEIKLKDALHQGERDFIVTTDAAKLGENATGAKLWIARSATRDFRKAKWVAMPMTQRDNNAFNATVPTAPADTDSKYAAAYGEIELAPNASSSLPTSFSTTVTEWQTRE